MYITTNQRSASNILTVIKKKFSSITQFILVRSEMTQIHNMNLQSLLVNDVLQLLNTLTRIRIVYYTTSAEKMKSGL